ncbi:GEM-like protein 5 [Malania oleifera]|uniref:GEM-like protein 5 n=1 Tax=Malania oleifera TaxID=397392 RepID=UPI0025AEA898|nr:GEM-like protein 5 [Malania oleifera]
MAGTSEESQPHQPSSTSPSPKPTEAPLAGFYPYPPTEEEMKKWGTHVMGAPAVPATHPDNQKAATWNAGDHQQQFQHQHPYLLYSPVEKPKNPLKPVIDVFNSWSRKAETIARNVWHNLRTGPSVSEAAWGKVNLTAKAISEGGFESLFKQTFEIYPEEKLKKTFACYLSTTTGPVAGTLYLSTHRVAFCSDRPLCFTAPSGQEAWSYYKVSIQWPEIAAINPVIMKESPSSEKYMQIVTVDGHDFWFMGFVNFEKASQNLSEIRAACGSCVTPVVG